MSINEIWVMIEPYVLWALAFLTSAGGAAFVGNLVAKRTVNRLDISAITKGVAERLSGSKLTVDLKAVTEKQLNVIKEEFRKSGQENGDKINLVLHTVTVMLDCIKSSAKLKDEEAQTLINALEAVKAASKPIEVKDAIKYPFRECARRATATSDKRPNKFRRNEIKGGEKNMTKRKILFTVFEALFYIIAPLVFVLTVYGSLGNSSNAVGFKLSFTGALLLLVLLWVARHIFLKKWLHKLSTHIVDYERDIKIKEGQELEKIKIQLKKARSVQAVLNALMPLVVMLLAIVMCKGLESEVVRLSGVCGFILVSFAVGAVFSVLNAREV